MPDEIWFLNQLRSAEIRGAGVIMKLSRLAETSALRADLTRHLRDEGNHAWLLTKAIVDLGGEVEEVEDPYQARLGAAFGLPRTVDELLAVTWVSERRGQATYRERLEAGNLSDTSRRAMRAILKDEDWHVAYIGAELDARRAADPTVGEAVARAEEADRIAMAALADLAASAGPS